MTLFLYCSRDLILEHVRLVLQIDFLFRKKHRPRIVQTFFATISRNEPYLPKVWTGRIYRGCLSLNFPSDKPEGGFAVSKGSGIQLDRKWLWSWRSHFVSSVPWIILVSLKKKDSRYVHASVSGDFYVNRPALSFCVSVFIQREEGQTDGWTYGHTDIRSDGVTDRSESE